MPMADMFTMPKWGPRAFVVALSMALLVGAGQSLRYHFYGMLAIMEYELSPVPFFFDTDMYLHVFDKVAALRRSRSS